MAQEKRKTGLDTYALAFCWAASFVAAAWVVPRFRDFFAEQHVWCRNRAISLLSRLVLTIPAAAWIALAVIVPVAVVSISRRVSEKTAKLLVPMGIIAFGVVAGATVVALLWPLGETMDICPAPEPIIPPPR